MRILTTWRLIAILLLSVVPLIGTAVPATAQPAAAVMAAQDSDDDSDDDDNRGHGNDEDGVDDDNPGQGNKNKDKNKDEKPKKDKGEVVAVDGYTIEVTCELDAESNRTTCAVSALAPEGAKDVGFVQIPAESVCAEVLETDAEYADPDPNTHVTGYKSKGNDDGFTLELDGAVTTSGTTDYWIKTGDGVFPATGPALGCNQPAATDSPGKDASATFTPPTPTAPATTGSLLVATYSCAGVPADTTGFDWFGNCQPAGAGHGFGIAPDSVEMPTMSAETGDTGEATFADLEPGAWELEMTSGSWCHAKSDRVTAESDLVVDAGQSTTVWIFLCQHQGGA